MRTSERSNRKYTRYLCWIGAVCPTGSFTCRSLLAHGLWRAGVDSPTFCNRTKMLPGSAVLAATKHSNTSGIHLLSGGLTPGLALLPPRRLESTLLH